MAIIIKKNNMCRLKKENKKIVYVKYKIKESKIYLFVLTWRFECPRDARKQRNNSIDTHQHNCQSHNDCNGKYNHGHPAILLDGIINDSLSDKSSDNASDHEKNCIIPSQKTQQ